jgi:hypothetical protein
MRNAYPRLVGKHTKVPIDLSDDDFNWLTARAAELKVSRASLIRQAVREYLRKSA